MTIERGTGLFDRASLPLAEEKPLAPGQPGKAWRRWGADGWSVDCKDGTRATTGNGTTRVTFQPRKS